MPNLPDKVKLKIQASIRETEELIKMIESGEQMNGLVENNDWLEPTILYADLPFNHERGELTYFNRIRDALKIALKRGTVPKDYIPYLIRAPPEIRGLLEEVPPYRLG